MDPIKSVSRSRDQRSMNLHSHFENLKEEFHKIEWTSKADVKIYTKVIMWTIFLFGMLIYLIDLTLRFFLNSFEFVFRSIFG